MTMRKQYILAKSHFPLLINISFDDFYLKDCLSLINSLSMPCDLR
jgi:hypothetical protein